jgi:hypothetical protein
MTAAKKKANELVDRYFEYVEAYSSEGQIENAKVCALILVSEIILSNPHSNPFNTDVYSTMEYWQEVKSEIKSI